ncbi:MAG: hypothetical protein FWH19_06045 [Treponema sp.]|nr:hypothetical protein [Treponema sp.]
MKRHILLCSLLIATCYLLPALDAGLVLDQNLAYSGSGDDAAFEFNGILVPRISGLLGNNGKFFVSGGLNYQNEPWGFIPELIEADFFFGFYGGSFRLGRSAYQDPLGFVVDGFFDGARLVLDTPAGVFSAAAMYAGFICKRRANIEMTANEYNYNNAAIEYDDFFNTYFAPSRAIAALEWEHPQISRHLRLKLSAIGQFDLADLTEEQLNSQYFIAKMTLPFSVFSLEAGGCFNLIQFAGKDETAFAAELGLNWFWRNQGLSLLARYSSGYSGDITPFVPVTTVKQGNVFSTSLVGMTVFSMDYSVRLHRTLSFNFLPAYFIDNYDDDSSGLLGGEVFGKLNWAPVSDILFTVGGGVFLPSLGNVTPDANPVWRGEMNIVISLF